MVEDGTPPYVLVAVLSPKLLHPRGMDAAKSELAALARNWNQRRQERKSVQRGLVFCWVDGDKWASWSSGMYGIKPASGSGKTFVVADTVVRFPLVAMVVRWLTLWAGF